MPLGELGAAAVDALAELLDGGSPTSQALGSAPELSSAVTAPPPRNDSQTDKEDAAALAAVPPVRRESLAMSVQARLPWIGLALWAVLIVAASTLSLAHDDLANAAITPALALFAGVGALLADRRPRNPIGWLLLAAALLIAFNVLLDSLLRRARPTPEQPGGADGAAGSGTGCLWCGSRRSACWSRSCSPMAGSPQRAGAAFCS